ncbi:helix-loop-helix DNA-binding domain-containing protein [Plectosphaerella cucumerina]|uniref:Helix-loop-helix DNA-binding domain-containing protein n=1 Tax=Plectosphaerella cucumerina TaxID=40658 RepID=A0A8K0TBH5_9PEZI|nr:helix-loop-helix DNA-binding domain-containing protein [Plectosphaerella cucumerina]
MSDDHPDLSELAQATASTSPGVKRKRSISDHGSPSRAKKNAPAAMMSAAEMENHAFIESAVEAVVSASGVNITDLNALQQATAAEHSEASDPANASSTAAAALGSMYPSIHVPPTTEEQFAAQAANENNNHAQENNTFHPNVNVSQPDGILDTSALVNIPGPVTPNGMSPPQPVHQALPAQHRYSTGSVNPPKKPDVGSEEWHKMRKDNHKEVERRRRETINEGINELAKIVPNCEKNKGSILQRAVTFINQLKENETQNIEKWTLEKLLTEQAIAELSTSNDKLKQECERLYKELETWKRVAQSHGLSLPQQNKEDAAPQT